MVLVLLKSLDFHFYCFLHTNFVGNVNVLPYTVSKMPFTPPVSGCNLITDWCICMCICVCVCMYVHKIVFIAISISLYPPGTLQQLISDTVVRWAQESVIEDPELVRAMFILLHHQYDGIREVVSFAQKDAYFISAWVELKKKKNQIRVNKIGNFSKRMFFHPGKSWQTCAKQQRVGIKSWDVAVKIPGFCQFEMTPGKNFFQLLCDIRPEWLNWKTKQIFLGY